MRDEENWFTETYPQHGSALSLRIKRKLHEEMTAFQKIEIFDTECFGKLMVIDGCTMVSTRENFLYHEMMTHPVLFTHPQPETVWIIGGGDCGSLREVLRHPGVKKATQIEIDERVTRLAEIHFPELCTANTDPRAELLFIDGIRWVKEAAPASVDVIIVDSTDPVGPAEGLFNEAFYRDCLKCLRPGGILAQQSESPLLHLDLIRSMYRVMGAAGLTHRQTLFFPQFIYPSGWWSGTMASATPFEPFREQAALAKPFATEYYSAAMHRAALTAPPFFERAVSDL
ncbi:polyamine aminopropyltransferase [Methylotetracoccus oryzae]|uniref:polyamine aminopropyltransferase n=1 Tax=Methylotetracoccus oryzae TaxID=1919059 RepID=UPI00111BCCE6|nr:polyamine aminopropyltransferase [Methylotetracoccus oryzae]